MVGSGGGEVALQITGVQKTKKENEKSCLWTGLIHRGEDSTKSGYKDMKVIKTLPVDTAFLKYASLGYFFPFLNSPLQEANNGTE